MHDDTQTNVNLNFSIVAFKSKYLICFNVNSRMLSFHRNTIPTKTRLTVDVKLESPSQVEEQKIIIGPLGLHSDLSSHFCLRCKEGNIPIQLGYCTQ
jgi:hypothetical protein